VRGDPVADGVRRQVVGERGEQVEQSLGLGHGQRDDAAVSRRELIAVIGQDRGGVRGPLDGRAAIRGGSANQSRSTERSRSIRAWPCSVAYVVYTATITFSTRPIVPEYCRPTAAVAVPFFACPV
jgi:hypothetical protein